MEKSSKNTFDDIVQNLSGVFMGRRVSIREIYKAA